MSSTVVTYNTEVIHQMIEQLKTLCIICGGLTFLFLACIALIGTVVIMNGINQIYKDDNDDFNERIGD